MSLRNKILNLLADIPDARFRLEVARTIYYLYQVFLAGGAPESEIKKALYEIAYQVIDRREPLLDVDTKKEKARKFAEDIYSAFVSESLSRMIQSKFKFPI